MASLNCIDGSKERKLFNGCNLGIMETPNFHGMALAVCARV